MLSLSVTADDHAVGMQWMLMFLSLYYYFFLFLVVQRPKVNVRMGESKNI
jgi:hypothetical protein